MEKLRILGMAGSLRKGSVNRALLKRITEISSEDFVIESYDLKDVPFYNGDVEDQGDPPAVLALKKAIDEADALLLVSPEYNASIPAVMKNAIDWASRPFGEDKKKVLNGKAVLVTGASPGLVGTMRMQMHLRETLLNVNCNVLRHPQIYVRSAYGLVNEDGRFEDQVTLEKIEKSLTALVSLAKNN